MNYFFQFNQLDKLIFFLIKLIKIYSNYIANFNYIYIEEVLIIKF